MDPATETASFEHVVQVSTGKDSNVVPGCVLTAVDSDGRLFYESAHGHAGVASDAAPLNIDATFWIASCTKLLTSICALQQVEKGLVGLDEDLERWLPDLCALPVISKGESTAEGYALNPRQETITLRKLLTHTSGVGYRFLDPLLDAWRKTNGPSILELRGKVTATYSTPLLFEPGSKWAYGGGLDWAGILVERLSGLTLGDYMRDNIFNPLSMSSTTFHLDREPEIRASLMPCSKREADDTLIPDSAAWFPTSCEEHSGGAGLWASASDFTKVLADLISPAPKLLSPKSIDEFLMTPQLPPSSTALKDLARARSKALNANAAALTSRVNHSLGGMLTMEDSDVLPQGTLSWGGLPNLKWFFNRELGVAGMFATQILPPGDRKSTQLANAFFTEARRLHRERHPGRFTK